VHPNCIIHYSLKCLLLTTTTLTANNKANNHPTAQKARGTQRTKELGILLRKDRGNLEILLRKETGIMVILPLCAMAAVEVTRRIRRIRRNRRIRNPMVSTPVELGLGLKNPETTMEAADNKEPPNQGTIGLTPRPILPGSQALLIRPHFQRSLRNSR